MRSKIIALSGIAAICVTAVIYGVSPTPVVIIGLFAALVILFT